MMLLHTSPGLILPDKTLCFPAVLHDLTLLPLVLVCDIPINENAPGVHESRTVINH
jgi:hypothetical protein